MLCSWHAPLVEQLASTLLCQEYVASVCNSFFCSFVQLHRFFFVVLFCLVFFLLLIDPFMFWYELSVYKQTQPQLSSIVWGKIERLTLWLSKWYLEYIGVIYNLFVICVTQVRNYLSGEIAKREFGDVVLSPLSAILRP